MKHVVFLESNPTSGLNAVAKIAGRPDCRVTFITSDLSFYLRNRPVDESPLRFAHRILQVADSEARQRFGPSSRR